MERGEAVQPEHLWENVVCNPSVLQSKLVSVTPDNKCLFFQQEKETMIIIPDEKGFQLQKDESIKPLSPKKENDGKYEYSIIKFF